MIYLRGLGGDFVLSGSRLFIDLFRFPVAAFARESTHAFVERLA